MASASFKCLLCKILYRFSCTVFDYLAPEPTCGRASERACVSVCVYLKLAICAQYLPFLRAQHRLEGKDREGIIPRAECCPSEPIITGSTIHQKL